MKHGWEYKKLGEVATFINGYAFKPDQWKESGYPIVRIQNLNNPNAPYNYFDGDVPNNIIIQNGDLLISWSASLGVYIWNRGKAFLNQHIFKVVFDKMDIDKFFLKYAVTSKLETMAGQVHGATMKHIVKKDFDNTLIPLPPKSTQQLIVAELDKINELIRLKKEQLEDYDRLAQSIFYDMFGDPVENEKGWERKILKEIVSEDCSISYGIVQPGDGVENGVPVVRPVDMTGTFVLRQGLKNTTKEISDSYKRTILKGNEILMCVRGTTGIVAMASMELQGCNVTRGVTPIECGLSCNKWFIYYQLLNPSIQQYIAGHTRGITLKQINMKDVRDIPLILPPLSLQRLFAQRIEQMERQKEEVKKAITDLETLLASRMQYWFE